MTQDQTVSVDTAVAVARQFFEQGQLAQCAEVCARILAERPDQAMAHHLAGLVAFRQGRALEAVPALERALELEPGNAMFLANSVEVMRSAGDFARAVHLGERAVGLEPQNILARANLGLAHYDNGDVDKARALHAQVLEQDPEYVASLNNLGSIARDEKDFETSKGYFNKVLALRPDHAESRNNLITVLIETNELDAALHETAIQLGWTPQMAEVFRNLGRILMLRFEYDAAERAMRHAISLEPGLALAHVGLSQVLTEKNHPDAALEAAQKALSLDRIPTTLHQAATCLAAVGRADEARARYAEVLDIEPGFGPSLVGLGHLELEHGDFDNARSRFLRARDADPTEVAALIGMSRLARPKSVDDPVFRAIEAEMPRIETHATDKQISLLFAYGDCLDGLGRYDEAFAHYSRGAALKRGTLRYDPAAAEAQVSEIIAAFTPATLDRLAPLANSTARPIFVLGMPRSGTTLTEAILAAHPQVHGAGELNEMLSLFHAGGAQPNLRFPRCLGALPQDELRRRLAAYDARLASLSGRPRVVDKMPANFMFIGLIHALFPNAGIVHLRRNPLDTCLSNFTRLFERAQPHSYDQVELARFHNGYARLMAHWERLLPKGAYHTVDYEALVADPEAQTRALLAHLGLPWDDACLDHRSSGGRVRTASVTQVRQPIYTGSVRKSESYRKHLGPLIAALDTPAV